VREGSETLRKNTMTGETVERRLRLSDSKGEAEVVEDKHKKSLLWTRVGRMGRGR